MIHPPLVVRVWSMWKRILVKEKQWHQYETWYIALLNKHRKDKRKMFAVEKRSYHHGKQHTGMHPEVVDFSCRSQQELIVFNVHKCRRDFVNTCVCALPTKKS